MILLDTNVISEPTKPLRQPRVTAWLNRQVPETLYLATTSLSDLLLGIELLPAGRRKQGLSENMDGLIRRYFGDRILAFDRDAAIACASIVVRASRQGYAIATPDGQIAAIAAVHGLTVATRDIAPFVAAGGSGFEPVGDLASGL